ncbi:MAG: hypothetical protein M0R05_01210 [Bacilli bacterium]|nr:hypothetical protein [Bacilli bacterium]MDD4076748.1 hypothetical protein [Bacilli bacterium]MDD4388564.1 hypothetical protein [Bacilli bacterium]
MRIFSFFKKPKEKVNIKVPEIPAKTLSIANDDEIYFERAEYVENKYNLEDCFDAKTKADKILDSVQAYDAKAKMMLHKYHFLKLFARVALRDTKYNEKMILLDKQINRIKKNYEDIKKRAEILKYTKDDVGFEFDNLFIKINELFDFGRDLNNQLADFQKQYYQNLKMATFSICKNKTYQQLDALNKTTNEMIQEYKSFQEAYDYIYYNSGELIVNTVNALVKAIKTGGVNNYIQSYPYQYFLLSDDVVVLRFAEWIDLFNKILYVIRTTNKIDLFSNQIFSQYYRELEKRYMIMLIYNEMGSKQ